MPEQNLFRPDMWNIKPELRCGTLIAWLCATGLSAAAAEPSPGFDCVITPSRSVDLGSPVPGQIHEVLVDRSDAVRAGQVLARLDSRLEEANLAIAEFKADTDTQVRLRNAALAIDLRAEERLKSLAATKVASMQDKDRAAREARLSAWRVQAAKDDLQLQALEKARAETALDRRMLRSPIDGVVVARLHEPGEYIEDEPLLRIVRLDPLHVEAILPMRLFGRVKPGMRASVTPEFGDGAAHQATVAVVDPMGDAASGTFGVRLHLPNPQRAIPAGLKCRVDLSTGGPVLSDSRENQEDSPRLVATDR